jgi:CRISPR-associated protein Cmr5
MSDTNTINKLEQGRADYAYQCALEGKNLGKSESKEYKSYTKKIPMMIKTNGLGSTLAFMKSKTSSKAYNILYNQIGNWLKESKIGYISSSNNEDLIKLIINMNSAEYRAVTVEVLSFMNWLRRFAEGLITD